jgi:tetratricopeptide (TPR) repeat protein
VAQFSLIHSFIHSFISNFKSFNPVLSSTKGDAAMKYYCLPFCLACSLIFISPVAAESTYGVQVFKTPTKQEALDKQESLLQKGYSPIIITRDGAFYKVIIGSYPDVLTPKWILEKMKTEIEEGEIVSTSNMIPIEESINSAILSNTLPNASRIVMEKSAAAADSLFNPERQEVTAFTNCLENDGNAAAQTYILNLLDTAPQDDVIRGWCMLKNSYLEIRQKNKPAAKERFKALAEGSVASTRAHRDEALMRYGFLLSGEKDKLGAYQAFKELKKRTDDPFRKAVAQVQQDGIVMKVSRGAAGGGGNLEDCRNACMKIFEYVTPETAPQSCATAELMYLETYFYQLDYNKSIELGLLFLEKYFDQTRETSMAIQFIGLALNATGEYDEAIAILERTFEKDFSGKETSFGADGKPWDMKKRAAVWIKRLAGKKNDTPLLDRLSVEDPEYFSSDYE